MKLLKPQKLKKGDTIGVLSVSGQIKDIKQLEFSKQYLENLGYKVKISETSYTSDRYFCADEYERADALNKFFADEEIKAVICTRGGYGAIKILDKIDYDLINKNPKIFMGYSDISAILWNLYIKSNLLTFHGAHAISTFQEDNLAQKSFWEIIENKTQKISTSSKKVFKGGVAKGAFIGGNLCTIASMCGTDFIPDEDFILFLEDINEPVYKIDRMFTQLLNTNNFQTHLRGIVLGGFGEVDNLEYFDIFWQEIADKLNIPICGNFEISHEKEHLVTPYGLQVELDANNCEINFLENYFEN
ncbi:LD-carboxypeptidase [bacterium]|nr:LD-carboxypeptidase [bacterium]